MAKIQIGKVVPTYAGEWRSNTEYLSQTVVMYAGSSYITLRDLTGVLKGVVPQNDGVNWRLLAKGGSKGDRGTDGSVSFNSLTAAQKEELKGARGDIGYHFTPSIDDSGNLSWTNDGNLENPPTVNIRGPQGDPGSIMQLSIVDGHLMLETTDKNFARMMHLGEDGHLYIDTSAEQQE